MSYNFHPQKEEQITEKKFNISKIFSRSIFAHKKEKQDKKEEFDCKKNDKNLDEIDTFICKVRTLFSELRKDYPQVKTPLAINKDEKKIKISRHIEKELALQSEKQLTDWKTKYNLSLIFGNGSSGKNFPNAGTIFENKILHVLYAWDMGQDEVDKIPDENLKKFGNDFAKELGITQIKSAAITWTGRKNTSRPIAENSGKFTVLADSDRPHAGEKLADITIDAGDQIINKVFLSCKFGEETSFFNLGLAKYFPADFFTNETPTANPKRDALLKFFGLKEAAFKDIFTSYKKQGTSYPQEDITSPAVMSNISNFVASGIADGYYLIGQKNIGSNIIIKKVTNQFCKKISTFSKATIKYGGQSGGAKKILIECENSYMYLKIDFRNSQSGLYPNKLMGYVTWKTLE